MLSLALQAGSRVPAPLQWGAGRGPAETQWQAFYWQGSSPTARPGTLCTCMPPPLVPPSPQDCLAACPSAPPPHPLGAGAAFWPLQAPWCPGSAWPSVAACDVLAAAPAIKWPPYFWRKRGDSPGLCVIHTRPPPGLRLRGACGCPDLVVVYQGQVPPR